MGRARKRKTSKRDKYASFSESGDEAEEDADLPRTKPVGAEIKRQYAELLGIRIEKLRGRILNRERINKTIEGIYFICSGCMKVCHSLNNGLTENTANLNNLCGACSKLQAQAAAQAAKEAAATPARPARPSRVRKKRAAAS